MIPYIEKLTQAVKSLCQEPEIDRLDTWVSFLKDWQTLIAGVVAFVPASLAAAFVWRQVNDQRNQFLRLHEKEHQKARLRLGQSLSDISRHLDNCYSLLIASQFESEMHKIDHALLDNILSVAPLGSNDTLAYVKIFALRAQQYASNCALYSSQPDRNLLVDIYRILAELDILTDGMYEYARFEADTLTVSKIEDDEIRRYLSHNLRRGQPITGTQLEKLIASGSFGSDQGE